MATSVIVAGARTPMGKLLGSQSTFSGSQLGGQAISAALDRAGVARTEIEYVLMGQVLTAGAGQLPARQAAIQAGIPMEIASTTVSKVCLSGIQALIMADQFIRTGDLHTVIAGGQESMSQAPRLLAGSRAGMKFGEMQLRDHMQVDGLEDAYDQIAMGLLTEQHNDREPIDRADMDAFALESHARALRAWKEGLFADEVIGAGGADGAVLDEGIREASALAGLTTLRPAFRPNGSITAGNASPISDGACALVVMSRERAESEGVEWLAEVGSHGMVAGPDTSLQDQPANAIARACEREGIDPSELDLLEINEAFAAVPLASSRKLGIGLDRVNVNGGAIALGHPIGMSGARIVLHLALELERRGGGIGAAALCGGGGQGDALIVRVPKK